MTSVRLSETQERKLDEIAQKKELSRSAIIKEALEQYLTKESAREKPYELGESLFGKYSSGDGSLSISYKDRVRSKLKSKFAPKSEQE